jgi:hypothetical protein
VSPSRRPRPVAGALATLAALTLLAGTAPAWARFPPARYFAGFADMKQQLGTVPLLADIAEIEKAGRPDKIYLEDCQAWAARALDEMADRLGRAGYRVGDEAEPTIGLLADPEQECWALSRFQADHRLELREQPLARPPFHVHEAFAAAPGALAEWSSVALAVWAADLSRRGADTSVPRADSLADLLGCDAAFVLLGLSHRVPLGRQIKEDLLDGGRDEARTPEFRRIVFAVVDLRRGVILWWDEDATESQSLLSWSGFRAVAKRFAARLP